MEFLLVLDDSSLNPEQIDVAYYNSDYELAVTLYSPKEFVDFGKRFGEFKITPAEDDYMLPSITLLA